MYKITSTEIGTTKRDMAVINMTTWYLSIFVRGMEIYDPEFQKVTEPANVW